MPLARVTGISLLSGCRAVLVCSSGWNCGRVGVVLRLAEAADLEQPKDAAGVHHAGPDVQTADIDRLGPFRDGGLGVADGGDLAVGDDDRAVGDRRDR